jgi:hypothetical protein
MDSKAIDYELNELGSKSEKHFLFITQSRLALGPTQLI